MLFSTKRVHGTSDHPSTDLTTIDSVPNSEDEASEVDPLVEEDITQRQLREEEVEIRHQCVHVKMKRI